MFVQEKKSSSKILILFCWNFFFSTRTKVRAGSCHKRQKPQAPIRNRQTRKVANAKGLNRNTNLT